jgi:hypothetical protein
MKIFVRVLLVAILIVAFPVTCNLQKKQRFVQNYSIPRDARFIEYLDNRNGVNDEGQVFCLIQVQSLEALQLSMDKWSKDPWQQLPLSSEADNLYHRVVSKFQIDKQQLPNLKDSSLQYFKESNLLIIGQASSLWIWVLLEES